MTMIRPTRASNPDLPITVGRQRVPRRYQHRQDGQIWREGADLGLLPTPNFVKIAERGFVHLALFYQKLEIFEIWAI